MLISVDLLGSFRLHLQARDVPQLSRKARALIAYLAAYPGKPVPREKLAALLWERSRSEQAQRSLRQELVLVRRVLGPYAERILASPPGQLVLSRESAEIDLLDFEKLVRSEQRHDIERGLRLYRDEVLVGFPSISEAFDEWKLTLRSRALAQAAEALERLALLDASAGDRTRAIVSARRLVELDPLREEGHRLLMRLYYASGRRAEALRQFLTCAEILKRELSASPEGETLALVHSIKQGVPKKADDAHCSSEAAGLPLSQEEKRLLPSALQDGESTDHSGDLPLGITSARTDVRGMRRVIEKPSIAVLPFQNLCGDPEQEYFVDGMVEEIITALSRIRWFVVVGRHSTFTYKRVPVDPKQIGRELAVRYLLAGSVRKSGYRVRIAAQLVEAETGAHLWADRFDGSLEDVFELQDRVASDVAGIIEPTLQMAETARSGDRPATDLTAYDLYLQADAMMLSSAALIPDALRLLENAIARDQRYGPALGLAAVCCLRLVQNGVSRNPKADMRKGADFARRALQVARDDPSTLANVALALTYFGEDHRTR